MNRPKGADDIEAVIKKLPTYKNPAPEGFTGEFHKAFKEGLTLTLHRILQISQEKGRLPNTFYEASIILVPKPGKDTTKKEDFRPISVMNINAKILNRLLATATSNSLEMSYTMINRG